VNDRPGSRGGWRRPAGILFVVIAFGFLSYFAARNAAELRAFDWALRPGLLAISLLLHILGLFWGVMVWRMLLRLMGVRVGFVALARVWFVSGLGRYIPGKIWQFVGAAHLGIASGLPAAVTVTSLAVHTGIFVIGALFTAVYFLPIELGEVSGIGVEVARWIAPAALVLVHPNVIRGALALVRRTTGRDLADWTGRWVDGFILVFLSTIAWMTIGLAFYLFLRSITPIPESAAMPAIAIHALAFVAGYLVFFVPAGLGAKEGALAAMLTLYVPAPVAALLAIAARLWTVGAEVIPALLLLLGSRSPTVDPAVSPAPPSSSAR
jgi:hypothetical protein